MNRLVSIAGCLLSICLSPLPLLAEETAESTTPASGRLGAFSENAANIVPGANRDHELLARKATSVLRNYCRKCHGPDIDSAGLGLDVSNVLGLLQDGYLDVKNPENSVLWRRITDGEMPPTGEPSPSVAEGEALRSWIAAGAPQPERGERAFVPALDVLTAIRDDLQQASRGARRLRRYFTLTHLHNHPSVDDAELRLHAAALAKALNSLSREREIALPEPIDTEGTAFVVNLEKLGWSEPDWQAVAAAYPYGLDHREVGDEALQALSKEIDDLTSEGASGPLVAVRADWFVVTATRPPLYHTLLRLPDSLTGLENRLGVDAKENFLRDRLLRAGFAESGVSVASRAVERHPANEGYYWKSFDFLEDRTEGNLFQQPLGPKFTVHPFDAFAFTHDGGEMIFSLPNGLQGYMLTNAAGDRIDEGPIAVVQDTLRTAGTPVVINGISCMHCHKRGVIPFRDTVRRGLSLGGAALLKTQRLYPRQDRLDEQLADDSERFMKSLDQVLRPFLVRASDEQLSIEDFPEPIGVAARRYYGNLSLTDAAAELGLKDSQRLAQAIESSLTLRAQGLGPLAHGGAIDRAFWQSRKAVISPLQSAARQLNLGAPLNVLPHHSSP